MLEVIILVIRYVAHKHHFFCANFSVYVSYLTVKFLRVILLQPSWFSAVNMYFVSKEGKKHLILNVVHLQLKVHKPTHLFSSQSNPG